MATTVEQRLRGVLTYWSVIPAINEYLSTIQIDDDNPGFLFNWHYANVTAFVEAANRMDVIQARPPPYLRTQPPNMTAESFIEDVMTLLDPLVGRRVGWVLLAPNTLVQFTWAYVELAQIQADDYLQAVARAAFPVNDLEVYHLAEIYVLTSKIAQRARPCHMIASNSNGQQVRQLFY